MRYQGPRGALRPPMNEYAKPRVVVAGVGAITSHGVGADALWHNVRSGRVAIRQVRSLPMDGYRTRLGGEVRDRVVPERDYRRPPDWREPAIDFAMTAAEEAMERAAAVLAGVDPARAGVVVGTCNAGLVSARRWYAERIAGGDPDPRLLALVTPQAIAEALAGAFGLGGPALSINTACAAGANAIGQAADLVRDGHVDAILAGGADAVSDVLFSGFNSLESLSPDPAAPYCRHRRGLSLGEGAGMLVLVREDLARAAGAEILAEIAGYGISAAGYHPTAPHPDGRGAARAIRAALDAAGVPAAAVGYVNTHGTGTKKNDPAETRATRRGLGPAADGVAVSSTKSMIGHLLGAAGAVEAIVTVNALVNQVAPPTANVRETDPECDLDCVPEGPRPLRTDVALSNNFAFGGANASLVFTRAGSGTARPAAAAAAERVVITGLATLTPAGTGPAQVAEALAAGRPGLDDRDGLRVGFVTPDPADQLPRRERRRMDRLGVLSVVAAQSAVSDAGLAIDDASRDRIGAVVGTGVGPMESMETFAAPVMAEGAAAANPAVFPNTVYNAAGGQIAMRLGALGPASTVTTGHAAGAAALCYARDLLARDRADAVIVVAADALSETVIDAYRSLDLGFGLAEAGVALVLETESAARARGARVHGELLGYAVASDTGPDGRAAADGRGLERAMTLAAGRAGVPLADIATVWSSQAGCRHADRAEAAAIRRALGADAAVVAPKLTLGEPMGAGGALATALALTTWQRAPGPALVNSCSLGGTHVSLVLAPPSTAPTEEA